jgi:CO/xanthine dehydrogenase Mo-binding subunit
VPRRIDIGHQETPSPLNPLGIKGAGEAGVIPGSAAIAAALEDALGIRITQMPLGPSQLYDLIRAARDGRADRTNNHARRSQEEST